MRKRLSLKGKASIAFGIFHGWFIPHTWNDFAFQGKLGAYAIPDGLAWLWILPFSLSDILLLGMQDKVVEWSDILLATPHEPMHVGDVWYEVVALALTSAVTAFLVVHVVWTLIAFIARTGFPNRR